MKATIISIVIALGFIGVAVMVAQSNGDGTAAAHNVTMVNGTQIIEITARGGYQPGTSVAKAGVPTIIRFQTNGTFDCSSSVRIASLGISKSLPQTGTTDIDIGSQSATIVRGSCGMGMYPFEINFQS